VLAVGIFHFSSGMDAAASENGMNQVFPEAVRGTIVLALPVFAVILVTIYWLFRVTLTARRKKARA
jgi:hypothetical protein